MKKLALAVTAFAAVGVALWLVLYAAFPYFYAESGSARYAREHRAEAMLQLLAAALLLWIAWYCIRRSLSSRVWLFIGGVLVAAAAVKGVADYRRAPDGAKFIGGNWYIVVAHRPGAIDTVIYGLYYKHVGTYQSVDDLVSEFHLVPPDCLTFRGLRVSDRPMYAMCDYRSPAGTYDTSTAEAALVAKARTQPKFRQDWQSIVQQEDFARRTKRR